MSRAQREPEDAKIVTSAGGGFDHGSQVPSGVLGTAGLGLEVDVAPEADPVIDAPHGRAWFFV